MGNIVERALHSQEVLRNKRKSLFKAFDILKENVNFGIDTISEKRKQEIISWYQKCLELDYDSINNYPSELKKYYDSQD